MKGKSLAIAILGKRKPAEDEGDEDEMGSGLDAAAKDVMAAVKANNVQDLKAALKDFVSMCGDYED